MNPSTEYTDQLRARSIYRRIRLVLSYVPALAGLAAVAVAMGAGLAAILMEVAFSANGSWLAAIIGGFVFLTGIFAAFVVYFVVQLAGEALTLLVDVADGLQLLNTRAGLFPEPGPEGEPIASPKGGYVS